MAQVIVRNIDDNTIARLKARAARSGHSLEQELRLIITSAARLSREEFRQRAAEMRERLRGRRHTDSVTLIREDRDR